MSNERQPIQRVYGQRVVDALTDLLEFGSDANEIVSRGKAAYDRDVTLRWAAEAVAHKIGEAVARLSPTGEHSFTADYPDLPWRGMKGLRNIVAHDYGRIDHEILWTAIAESYPAVVARIQGIIDAR